MVEMGRPVTPQERSFGEVTMAPKPLGNNTSKGEEKEDTLNRISGKKRESTVKNVDDHNKMGKDEFLKLLSFQLQNQDPFKPMDQNKFSAELAQFAQLEQLTNLNKKFENNEQGKIIQERFFAAGLVGKSVVTDGNSIEYKGEKTDIVFNLEDKAEKVAVRVIDKLGNIVSEMWQEKLGRGAQTVKWDGTSLDGSMAKKGDYSIQVLAWDGNDQQLKVETRATGLVESVSFDTGTPVLNVQGRKVSLRDVKSFHLANNAEQSQNEVMAKPSAPVQTQEALKQYGQQQGAL